MKYDAAVIGIGEMGKTHVEALQASPYVNTIYGFEPDEERRISRAAELGIQPATFEEIMANPDIRLVTLASPNGMHVQQAMSALAAGKCVMCEKPMGTSLDEARKLIKAYQPDKQFLQIGFELHYSKLYQLTKQWIDEGRIGQVVNIQTRYFCCEFHRKNNWRSNSYGSFLIGEKLSHYLDLQRWFMGCEAESVYSVSAPKVVSYFNHRDNHNITLKFKNGGVGVLNFIMYAAESYHEDPLRETLEKQSDDGHYLQYMIVGTKGAIENDVFRRRMRRWEFSEAPDGLESQIVETITYPKEVDLEWIHNTHGQNVRIAELVALGKKPEVSPFDAFETMKICFAAEQSEDTGKIISLADI